MAVSGNLFDVIGVQPPSAARSASTKTASSAAIPVVVLDHDLWASHSPAIPAVVGRHFGLGGAEMTVVGVMPAGFTGPDQFVKPGFYLPVRHLPAVLHRRHRRTELTRRDIRNFVVKGRLAPGVSLAQAAQEMALFGAGLGRAIPRRIAISALRRSRNSTSRIDARPQFVVVVTMLMLLSGWCCWSRAPTWRAS